MLAGMISLPDAASVLLGEDETVVTSAATSTEAEDVDRASV